MSFGSCNPEEEVGGQLQKDTIVRLASIREGLKNLQPFLVQGTSRPPFDRGQGWGLPFAPVSLHFNNKTQNILALMYVFIVSCCTCSCLLTSCTLAELRLRLWDLQALLYTDGVRYSYVLR